MGKSFKSYISDLGYWGLIVIAPIVLDTIGIYQLTSGNKVIGIPSWVWFQIAFLLLLLIPFIAYHKKRVELEKVSENRARELARFILEVRDKAARVVMRKQTGLLSDTDLMNEFNVYSNALEILDREADIDGGKIREAIMAGFTTFVGFHVTRFLAWNGKILSDPSTKQKLEIDELQFVGRMASRADETIQKIRHLTK